jgi:hypothetical protein
MYADVTFTDVQDRLSGLHEPVHWQVTFNQYVARTDKLRKPRFLCLTGVYNANVFAKVDAGSVILETRCHPESQAHLSPLTFFSVTSRGHRI